MRNRLTRAIGALVLLALLTLPGQVGAQWANPSAANLLPPTFALPGDWPMYGHDVSRTNYNPDETTISAANVAQLVQRWQVNVGSGGTATSAAPSVADGVVYVSSSVSTTAVIPNFYALNAVTGSTIWSKDIGYRSSCFNVGIGSTPAISGTVVVVGADNLSSNPS
jgi:outer membrane protein assembly factor BamB